MLEVIYLAFILQQATALGDVHWGYETGEDEIDPDHWHEKYENCKGGRQSPIDIEKEDVFYDPYLKPFTLHGYDERIMSTKLINDGHTVTLDMPDGFEAKIIVPFLNTTYKLKQLHFHWGHNDSVGSEHVVFKEHFPLEMHMVHLEQNVTFEDALKESNGIVVISVLFRLGNENKELDKLTDAFYLIADPDINNVTVVKNITLRQLMPKDIRNFLQYAGSLTTPPCNEAVRWIILTHTAQLSHTQMAKFRTIEHDRLQNGKITKEEVANDRLIQNINGRTIQLYYAFDDLADLKYV